MLDRIDIHIEVPSVDSEKLSEFACWQRTIADLAREEEIAPPLDA